MKVKMTGQIWGKNCERCGRDPVYMPLMLCEKCWPNDEGENIPTGSEVYGGDHSDDGKRSKILKKPGIDTPCPKCGSYCFGDCSVSY